MSAVTVQTFAHGFYDHGLVVIEDYAFGPGHLATIASAELAGSVKMHLYRAGIDFVGINPMSLKKWATGNGNASKIAMIDTANRMIALTEMPRFVDDNAADAYLLWSMAGWIESGDEETLSMITHRNGVSTKKK